ncbi:MAG TPA: tautomerase family protein [Mycobacterium sp.]
MPLVRVSLLKGKAPEHIRALSDAIYRALVESYGMPENDLFQIFEQLEPGSLLFDRNYGGGPRSDDFMLITIRSDARRADEKEALMTRLVDNLATSAGVRGEDVFIVLETNSTLEDYSFSSGISATQMVAPDPSK